MVTVKYFLVVVPFFIQGVVARAQEQAAEATDLPQVPNYGGYPHYDHYHDYPDYHDNQPYHGDYGAYDDHLHPSEKDYGTYDYVWEYGDDYPFLDYYGVADDRIAYGDRNNPVDTLQHVQEETAVMNQLPVETFLFQLGDFGMGHLDLGDWGMEDWYDEYYAPEYDYMADYADYGHRPPPAELYGTGDQLDDKTTLDYPGIDHDPFWVDWIFMVPPGDMVPVVR